MAAEIYKLQVARAVRVFMCVQARLKQTVGIRSVLDTLLVCLNVCVLTWKVIVEKALDERSLADC